ncbi:Endonuclease-reverse transcriptase [Popillia japonica]|uniref:Endonuclease-reverse transcriptase n=1 Tax=Popillia japonica TaxID=7064 RepID=A0AAW1JYN0_POPJA
MIAICYATLRVQKDHSNSIMLQRIPIVRHWSFLVTEQHYVAADSNSSATTKSFIPCKVCGDKASGYHYGVTSCEESKKKAIESMIETHLGIKVNTKKVYKIDKKRCVAELADWDEKMKILRVKSKLKGKDIYIDSELTLEERSIQRKIRDKAREERNRGARVRVKYQQLEVNGKRRRKQITTGRVKRTTIRETFKGNSQQPFRRNQNKRNKKGSKGLNNDEQQTEEPQRKASDGKLCKIGTWNVRGTYSEGALKNLAAIMKKYEIDILAVQETKQKGQEIITLDGYTLFNSGGENRRLGVGFLLRNDFKDKVVDFEPVSERICRVRLRGKYRKISLLNVHAPTEDKDPIVKSEFYEELEKVLEKVPKFDIKLVLGDLNAKIGREDEHRKITGGNSKHMLSSENGKMLIQFALENNLKIMSTNFKHKEIHQTTWMSPDFKTRNQIDHVLIEYKHQRCITDVRTYRGADAVITKLKHASDHFLVITKLKQAVSINTNIRNIRTTKYNLEEMKDQNTLAKIELQIDSKLTKLTETNNIEHDWRQIEEKVQETLEICLGGKAKKREKDWFDEECKTILQIRNAARANLLRENTEATRREYEEARKRAKQICRQKKRKCLEATLEKIEQSYINKDLRNFYQETKKARNVCTKNAIPFLKNSNGELIGNTQGKLKIMKEHFEKVFWNEDEHEECEAEGNFHWEERTDRCGVELPNETEIMTEINRLKKQ